MTEQTEHTDEMDHTVEFVPFKTRVELNAQQIGALMAPLAESRVKTRSVSGSQQSYVEAYDIKATLIRVFGFGGFSVEVVDSKILDIRDNGKQGQYPPNHNKAGQDKTPYVMAQSTVRLTIHGIGPFGQDVIYTETAIGTNDGWTIGDVADNAIKSAASDALKRCAIYLGTQFGLGLYNNGSLSDVVRVILEPEQQALLIAARAEQQEKQAEQQRMTAEQEAQVARSLGGRRIDTPEQTRAEIEKVVADRGVAADDELAQIASES